MTTCRCSKGLYHISLSSENKYLTCQLVVPSAQSLMGAISQGLGMEKGYVEIVRRLSFIRWFIASPRDPVVTLYTRVLTVSQVGTDDRWTVGEGSRVIWISKHGTYKSGQASGTVRYNAAQWWLLPHKCRVRVTIVPGPTMSGCGAMPGLSWVTMGKNRHISNETSVV